MANEPDFLPELHLLIRKGLYHAVRFVISRKNVNARDPDGRTPLILCCFLDDENMAVGIARMLIEKGGKIGLDDKCGVNALMYSVLYRRIQLTEVYLGAMDYELNHRDKVGNTALYYAALLDNPELLQQLVRVAARYGETVDVANKRGMTPLLESCRLGHDECARILAEEGGASEVLRDKVFGKNSHQWRMEHVMASGLPTAAALLDRPRTAFVPRPNKKSSWTATAVSSCFTQVRRPKTGGGGGSKRLPRPRKAARVFDPSADLPPANWPAHIKHEKIKVKFRVLPLEEIYSSSDRRKSLPLASPRSTAPARFGGPGGGGESWKREMNTLYNNFAYQVSDSYRKRAVSKMPSVPELIAGAYDLAENDSETSSRRGNRRASVFSNASSDSRERGEDVLSPIRPMRGVGRRMSVASLEECPRGVEGGPPKKGLGRRKSMMLVGVHESSENLLSVSSSSGPTRRRLSVPSVH